MINYLEKEKMRVTVGSDDRSCRYTTRSIVGVGSHRTCSAVDIILKVIANKDIIKLSASFGIIK